MAKKIPLVINQERAFVIFKESQSLYDTLEKHNVIQRTINWGKKGVGPQKEQLHDAGLLFKKNTPFSANISLLKNISQIEAVEVIIGSK